MRVSILVLLDDAYRHGRGLIRLKILRVSILVLLDDAYRRQTKKRFAGMFLGFNPCSSG